jgi:NAD(P)H-hydrate epimerase
MRVVTAAQIADLDRQAVEEHRIPVARLMEAAGRRVAQAAETLLREQGGRRVVVLTGKGNNGGDGLVAARYLRASGFEVTALLAAPQREVAGEAARALTAAAEAGVAIVATGGVRPAEVYAGANLIVDALFGTGFRGPAKAEPASLIEAANQSGRPILAVDVPSGLQADTGRWEGPCIRATATVTMGLPKVGLLLYPGAEMAGTVYVGDIGYPQELIDRSSIPTWLVTAARIRALLPPRQPDTHKGTYGHVLIVAGSVGFTGAAVLATLGALRSGAGLVTVAVPQSIYPIVASQVTEGMPTPLQEAHGAVAATARSRIQRLATNSDVVAVGPGMSRAAGVARVIEGLMKGDRPLVIDADGLNVLAGHAPSLTAARAPVVITPHPGELSRLVGRPVSAILEDRLGAARAAAAQLRCVVVLKGARTIVANVDGEAALIPTGNPGMATGGMGDVLTGAVAAMIGQRLAPFDAAVAAAYLHGLAGDLVAEDRGHVGLLASEVADRLPQAIHRVQAGLVVDAVRELRT